MFQVRKEEEKEAFEIGDFDNMPLAVIRDRQRQAKRPTLLIKREDEVLKIHRTRIAAGLFYKPEQFCRLAHVFSVFFLVKLLFLNLLLSILYFVN